MTSFVDLLDGVEIKLICYTAARLSTTEASGPLFGLVVVYLAARGLARLLFYGVEVAYFQSQLAHAGYVATPEPRWPESASVEALTRLR